MLKHHKDPRHLMTHEGRPALSLSFGAGNTLIVTYVTEAGSEVTVLDYGDRKLTWADVRREM